MADAIGRAVPDGSIQGMPESAAGGCYVIEVSRRAMACQFEVHLNAGQYEQGTEVALEALDLVDALEDQMSVFRENSEVCCINRTAAAGPVEVEPRLFELLGLAMRLYGETDGAFDLTAEPLWEAWGFARRAGTLPSDAQLAEALQNVGSRLVELDAQRRTIRLLRQGVRLNFGGLGKGYALDRCAEVLLRAGVEDFLIHGGHSSVLARGARAMAAASTSNAPGSWSVGVRHPLRPNRRLAEVRLRDRALATSGSRIQSFMHAGRRYGHILDPRTGQPADGVLSATAIAPTAAEADALSTAFYVMGPQATLDFCQSHTETAAVLVCAARHDGGVEIQTAGLADEDFSIRP